VQVDGGRRDKGGRRLIPGSHRQGFWSMCFRKPYFVWHRDDPAEIAVETEPGDLTVHDGRLWHRVARSRYTGAASLRRSLDLPYPPRPYAPDSRANPTPACHRVGEWLRGRRQAPASTIRERP